MSGCVGGRTNEVQSTVDRVGKIPEPGRLFIFIDENEDSIDTCLGGIVRQEPSRTAG